MPAHGCASAFSSACRTRTLLAVFCAAAHLRLQSTAMLATAPSGSEMDTSPRTFMAAGQCVARARECRRLQSAAAQRAQAQRNAAFERGETFA